MNKSSCFAYIDGANLHKGVQELGWNLDYGRFRVWLREKYRVDRAYLFIGFIPGKESLYAFLQEAGFVLIFKEIAHDNHGAAKGNCDASLVLKTTIDFYEKAFAQAVLVSSDGDYSDLVSFLKTKRVFRTLISPSNKCSYLLRKRNVPLLYLDTQRRQLEKLL